MDFNPSTTKINETLGSRRDDFPTLLFDLVHNTVWFVFYTCLLRLNNFWKAPQDMPKFNFLQKYQKIAGCVQSAPFMVSDLRSLRNLAHPLWYDLV